MGFMTECWEERLYGCLSAIQKEVKEIERAVDLATSINIFSEDDPIAVTIKNSIKNINDIIDKE